MSDGLIVIVFIIGLFILWLFVGGPNHANVNQPFEQPYTEKINGAFVK